MKVHRKVSDKHSSVDLTYLLTEIKTLALHHQTKRSQLKLAWCPLSLTAPKHGLQIFTQNIFAEKRER